MILKIEDSIKFEKIGLKKYYYFNCTNCNKEFKVEINNLYRRKTTCCQYCSSAVGLKKINIKHPYQAIYTKLLNSAKKKNIFCNLTFEQFLKFTDITNCTYCNTTINWKATNNRYNLDRKDNTKNYVYDNLTVCCWLCNNTKSNRFTHDEFILLADALKLIQFKRSNENTK